MRRNALAVRTSVESGVHYADRRHAAYGLLDRHHLVLGAAYPIVTHVPPCKTYRTPYYYRHSKDVREMMAFVG